MRIQLAKHVVVSFGIALGVAACAHETETTPAVTTTTAAAAVPNDAAVLQIAKARCGRASECNILGNGRPYADKDQCMDAYKPGGGALENVASCPNGVDKGRLDKCIAVLRDQHCDANLGPETAMPECRSYCTQ
jgi:hypothetical protein